MEHKEFGWIILTAFSVSTAARCGMHLESIFVAHRLETIISAVQSVQCRDIAVQLKIFNLQT